MKNPTILHLTPFFSPNLGGVETHLNDLISYLRIRNFKTIVLTYQALAGRVKGKKQEISKNLEIYRIPWITGLFDKTKSFPLFNFLYLTPVLLLHSVLLLLRKGREIKIIHAHGINAAYAGALAKILFGKPLVISIHVELNFKKDSFLTKAFIWPLKKADKLLVLTKNSKESLVKLGLKSEGIEIYSYWVDQENFRPIDKVQARKKVGIKENKFVALFVGRLVEEKGVGLILQSAERLKEIDFYFAGTGSLEEDVKKFTKKLSNVHYLGVVDSKSLPLYYSTADILLVPSLVKTQRPTFEEGVPRVIIEAISCGLPVLGTDNGGVKEVIELGDIGVLIESDTESLVSALLQVSRDQKRLEVFKAKCRRYAVERFSVKGAEIFERVYRRFGLWGRLSDLLESTGDMALKRRARRIIEGLNPQDGDDILDVGCGDGYYLYLLSNLGLRLNLTGVDSDEKALESAKRNLNGGNIKLVHADLMTGLPFGTGNFDKAVMSEVAEHLPNAEKGLREVSRVLKKNATLALSVPNHNYPMFWDPVNWVLERLFNIHIKSGFWAGIWNQHLRLYRPDEIKKVVEKSGFRMRKFDCLTFWCLPFNHQLVNLVARLLYGGRVGESIAASISKYRAGTRRPMIIEGAFKVVNAFDRLNDLYSPQSSSVSLIVVATNKNP